MPHEPSPSAHDLIAFYLEMGVDVAIDDVATNRLAPAEAEDAARLDAFPPAATQTDTTQPDTLRADTVRATLAGTPYPLASPAPAANLALPTPEAAVMSARAAAGGASTLAELRTILDAFEGCALRIGAKQLVFEDGNPQGRVMFVGEAPGRDEDIQGLPFVGRSGKLLDLMMTAIGLDRTSAYIANIIPWRPPGNRTPTPQESQICLPFIKRQIELADPDILVCLGGPSAQALLGVSEGIMRTRGRWLSFHTGAREIRAIATLHPAYLLRQPLAKRLAWRDFLAIKAALDAP